MAYQPSLWDPYINYGDPYINNLFEGPMLNTPDTPETLNFTSGIGGDKRYASVPEGMRERISDATIVDERRLDPEGSYPMPVGRDQGPLQYRDPQQYYMENRPYDYDGGWRGPIASTGRYPDDGGYVEYQERYPHPYDSWIGREYSQADLAEEANRKGFLTSEGEHNPMLQRALINRNRQNLYGNEGIGAIDIQETITPEKLTILDEQLSGPVIESNEEEEYINQGITRPNILKRMFTGIGDIFRGASLSPAQRGHINRYGRNPITGRITSGPFRGQNLFGTSMFGSKTAKEQALKNLNRWGKTAPDARINQWENIIRGDRAEGTGTTVTGHGKSGMGRDPSDRMAHGGRVGYNTGGRVGILAAF